MNPSSLPGRLVISVRRLVNAVDLKVFGFIMAALTFVALWALLASVHLPSSGDLKVGQVATDFVRAPASLTFTNSAETQQRRQQAADNVAPVLSFDPSVLPKVTRDVGTYFDTISGIVSGEAASAQAAGQPYNPARAAQRIQQIPGAPQISAATASTLAGLSPDRLAAVRQAVLDAEQRILEGNVTDASLPTDKDRLKSLLETMPLSQAEMDAASDAGGAYLAPNNIYDAAKTQQARDQASAGVPDVVVTVRSGETILSPGQVITDADMATLQALGLTGGRGGDYGAIAGIGLLCLIEVTFVAFYVRSFERRVRESRAYMFIVVTLLLLFTGLDRVAVIAPLSPLVVPMAALGMLGTMMLQTRLSSILVVLASVNLAIIGGSDPQYILVALFGGLSAVFLVTNAIHRRDLLKAGLIASMVVAATAVGASQISHGSLSQAGSSLVWALGNGFLSIVAAMGLITIYEMVFNLPTPLKLLELADPTRPLLKELMMKAPGTYNHSIIMGNIAETAAEAIGANPLLARVGAYYHDIGKLNRPDYFIENQFHIKNPHDRLTPGLSRLAITAHVKDGVRLARDEGLPPDIVDIIKEHHGTTVLQYFYHKAKETAGQGQVDEETYRYAGQKPASREAAIIMLADSVEAAVRSLKNPTIRNIKTVIRDIFDQRLRDGQLSESQMTFGDLEKVRNVFEKSLRGFGATRIAYPSKREPEPQAGRRPVRPTRAGGAG